MAAHVDTTAAIRRRVTVDIAGRQVDVVGRDKDTAAVQHRVIARNLRHAAVHIGTAGHVERAVPYIEGTARPVVVAADKTAVEVDGGTGCDVDRAVMEAHVAGDHRIADLAAKGAVADRERTAVHHDRAGFALVAVEDRGIGQVVSREVESCRVRCRRCCADRAAVDDAGAAVHDDGAGGFGIGLFDLTCRVIKRRHNCLRLVVGA